MKVLIGSEILRKHFPDLKRENSDIDYLVKEKTEKSTRDIEYHVIPPLWEIMEPNQKYITLDQLYTLKVSHSYWDKHWNKTIYDIIFLTESGCILDKALHDDLYDYWKEIYKPKNVNLNKTTEEFFDDSVEREFNHDQLHEVVAYYDEPLYKKLLIDPSKPLISKKKFFEMSHIDQIRTVKEEAMTIGLERYYIPKKTYSLKVSYMRALKTLITSASKGWFPTFIVLNYKEISKLDFDYKDINIKIRKYEC